MENQTVNTTKSKFAKLLNKYKALVNNIKERLLPKKKKTVHIHIASLINTLEVRTDGTTNPANIKKEVEKAMLDAINDVQLDA